MLKAFVCWDCIGAPEDRISTRILQAMMSGIPAIVSLGARM